MELSEKTLSDTDISILCDVGSGPIANLDEARAKKLKRLNDAGLVKRCHDEMHLYTLTGKGERILSERGVGLNEA
jgi:hypothetical protein